VNQLITMVLEQDEAKWLAQFPEELMTSGGKEIADYILAHRRTYGEMPSLKRVMERHEGFIPFSFSPTRWETEEPDIAVVFDDTVKRKLLELSERKLKEAQHAIAHSGEVPLETIAEIEKIHTLSLGVHRYSKFDRDLYFRRTVMRLPFRIIDREIGGLSNGDFMLIVGRLGTGKSTIAQHIAKFVWEKGQKILFVSAEMLGLDVFSRIDAMVGKFNPLDLRRGSKADMKPVLGKVLEKVTGRPGEIIIPRSRLLTPLQIATFAKNLDVNLIIVDGAYLLNPSSGRFTSKWEKVATVSNELKQTALDLDIPMIATAQIKRGADGSDGYTPEDIALSDALGQDADFVLAAWPNPTMKARLELQLIKNRYGSECATQIHIDYETMEIVEESIKGRVGAPKEPVSVEEWIRT